MATNIARFSVHAQSVIHPDDGREQITIKILVKKRVYREQMFTVSPQGDVSPAVARWLWNALDHQLIMQSAVHYASVVHPFQEELPF